MAKCPNPHCDGELIIEYIYGGNDLCATCSSCPFYDYIGTDLILKSVNEALDSAEASSIYFARDWEEWEKQRDSKR